jgi:hypothetical protein
MIDATARARWLQQVADAIEGGTLSIQDAQALAISLRRCAGGVADPFELRPQPGHRTASTRLAYEKRDELLRLTAFHHYPEKSLAEQARRLHAELSKYAVSAWQRERVLDEAPSRYREGDVRLLCWRILKAVDHVLTVEAIRKILGTS